MAINLAKLNRFKNKMLRFGKVEKYIFIFIFTGLAIIYLKKPTKSSASIDLVITVKTSFKSHRTRISQIVDTWYQLALDDIYFITDAFDPLLNQSVNGHLINTTCGSQHDVDSLGCKLNQELKVMISKKAAWSCHVDDDNYVNVPVLKKTLQEFDSHIPYYLGRTSTVLPTIINRKTFWFATGGAGFCLSFAALKIIAPKIHSNEFYFKYVKSENMPDDVAFGYMLDEIGIQLTEVGNFLSHYDKLETLPSNVIQEIAILSNDKSKKNLINLPYFFHPFHDPFKFQTLHCFLFPTMCNKKLKRLGVKVHTNSSFHSYGKYTVLTQKM